MTEIPTITDCRAEIQEGLVGVLGEAFGTELTDVRSYLPQTPPPATAWIELMGVEAGETQNLPYAQARATWRVTVTARPGMAVADATAWLDRVAQVMLTLDVGGISISEYVAISGDALASPLPAVRITIKTIITRKAK
ncbi:hypothetical protein [Corynebacterium matruchotii]|uniref:hypothetical protein n=1 Tax=Corynebacterium matruchotii TaxID=43768 RepID=UPI003C6EEA16